MEGRIAVTSIVEYEPVNGCTKGSYAGIVSSITRKRDDMALIGVRVLRLCRSKSNAPPDQALIGLHGDDFQPAKRITPRDIRGVHFSMEECIEDEVSRTSLRAVFGEGMKSMTMSRNESEFLNAVLRMHSQCRDHVAQGHSANGSDCPGGPEGIPTLIPQESPLAEGTRKLRLGFGLRVGSLVAYRPPGFDSLLDFRVGKVIRMLATHREQNVQRVHVHKYDQNFTDLFTPRTIVELPEDTEDMDPHVHITTMDFEDIGIVDIICILDTDGVIGNLRNPADEKIYYRTD